MNTVILLTFLLRGPSGVIPEDLAIVKDMETCKTLAAILNETVKDDPNAAFMCREVRPERA